MVRLIALLLLFVLAFGVGAQDATPTADLACDDAGAAEVLRGFADDLEGETIITPYNVMQFFGLYVVNCDQLRFTSEDYGVNSVIRTVLLDGVYIMRHTHGEGINRAVPTQVSGDCGNRGWLSGSAEAGVREAVIITDGCMVFIQMESSRNEPWVLEFEKLVGE